MITRAAKPLVAGLLLTEASHTHPVEPVPVRHGDRRRDDRLGAREDAVPGVGCRVAERLERDELTVPGDRDLARREPAALHVGPRRVEQLSDFAHRGDRTCNPRIVSRRGGGGECRDGIEQRA